MKLYLIRHGESEGNLARRHTGQSDVPLTEKGRRDALRAGRLLEGIAFDRVFSSDLTRAIQTQQLALPEAAAVRSALLRELDVGDLAGWLVEDCKAQLGETYFDCRRKRDFTPYNGESNTMQRQRLQTFLDTLPLDSEETVALFCHAGIVTCMAEITLELDNAYYTMACDNGSVSVFSYADGRWRLLKWNHTGEL